MSSRKKARVFEALSRKNRFWFRNDNYLTTTTIPGEIRFKSSATTSSGRFLSSDFEGNKGIPPARSLNGVMRKDSNRKRAILPPETNGHATILSKDSKKAEAVIEDKNKLSSSDVSPSVLSFTGGTLIPVTSYLHIVTPDEDTPRGVWPIFRMMDEDGTLRDGSRDGYKSNEEIVSNKPSISTHDNDFKKNEGETKNDLDSSLSSLRASLCQRYPNQSSEINRSRLLQPSKVEYVDVKSKDTLTRLLRHMLRLRELDTIFQNAQRQGRISFYLTCRGEEGIHFGAASALENQDVILGQYREQGPLMWRGFTLQQFADQCFSNEADLGKGRQMPIHYGSRALNYQTISSPLGTQIPQAVGVALRLKLSAATEDIGSNKKAIAICFFGEGCTSTTDFHSGLNFAATLKCPVVFFCRNNGYAISTSVKEQYVSDGVVSKAPGYGMAGIRVDGNDVFAVHAAVREAREYALENNAPVLIEAMSYRQGHHSTSDDSSQYRSIEEVEHFAETSDPLDRLQNFLKLHEYDDMTDDKFISMIRGEKEAILDAMRKAENKPKPTVDKLFTDVYKEMTPSLQAQQNELREHMDKYNDSYTL